MQFNKIQHVKQSHERTAYAYTWTILLIEFVHNPKDSPVGALKENCDQIFEHTLLYI